MMNVKQAVAAAIAYMGEFQDLIPSQNVRLEETELDEKSGDWLITLSTIENPIVGSRSYRVFYIDSDTGIVKSMKKRIGI